MRCLDESFASCLEGYDLAELDRYPGTIYAMRADFRLAYMNSAWFQFAEENGGEPEISRRWPLGAPVMPAISAALRSFYEIKFRACLKRGTPWMHDYECSSEGVYRNFRQTTYPLKDSRGLLVVNSLSVALDERAEDPTPRAPDESKYRGGNGAISQCVHCRRVRISEDHVRWDLVPAWLAQPPAGARFTLCGACRERHLNEPALRV